MNKLQHTIVFVTHNKGQECLTAVLYSLYPFGLPKVRYSTAKRTIAPTAMIAVTGRPRWEGDPAGESCESNTQPTPLRTNTLPGGGIMSGNAALEEDRAADEESDDDILGVDEPLSEEEEELIDLVLPLLQAAR